MVQGIIYRLTKKRMNSWIGRLLISLAKIEFVFVVGHAKHYTTEEMVDKDSRHTQNNVKFCGYDDVQGR